MSFRVNVIITAYNTPKDKLARALESVLTQSVESEIVVVNDGGAKPDLGKYGARVKYVAHDRNYGGAKALNTGLENSSGEFVSILDSDDYYTDKNKLKKQMEFLETNPAIGAVSTGYTVLQIKRGVARKIEVCPRTEEREIFKHILDTSPLAHSGIMYRKSALNYLKSRYGYIYDEDFKRGKDWDILLRMARHYKLANLTDNTITFENIWIPEKRFQDAKAVLRILWKYRQDYPGFWRNLPEAIARYCYFLFFKLYKNP